MEFDINSIVRENVKRLKPYSTARDDFKGRASLYLDANENPLAMEHGRYPDPKQHDLKEALATLKQLNPGQVIPGNGSDEIIDLLIRAFCEPGIDNIIVPQPTYGMYKVYADINRVEARLPLLTASFDIDIQAIYDCVDGNSKIIFLCSPNNPSGNLLDQNKTTSLLQSFHGLVVVDEAYIDFANSDGFLPLINRFPNLVVLQTFSKAWGLAALRLGIGYGSWDVVQILDKIKPPYNINSLTQQKAMDAIDDREGILEWARILVSEREKLEKALEDFPFVQKVYPSQANFLLVKLTDARACYQFLLNKGIIVRDRSSTALCGHCLRISIGSPEGNKVLIQALKEYQNTYR